MTAALPFPLPPGRVLSAWRRELAAFRPRRLRLAHLLLHRVEALVRVARSGLADPLRAALLRQIAGGAAAEGLGVDRDVLGRWLCGLAAEGLVEPAGEGWRLTESGRRALDAGPADADADADAEERRVFTFLDETDPDCLPTFVAMSGAGAAMAPPPGWRFDPAALEACVRRPAEWKARHGFAADVQALVAPPGAPAHSPADWRRLILDRPEEIVLVFVPSDAAALRWLGFAARPDGWALQTAAPALLVPSEDVLPELAEEPSAEAWREAWRGWCRGRGLPADDAGVVDVLEDRLRVALPRGAARRLGADRDDAWLLAGSGRVRVAAPLEIAEEA